jgi:hypothetical protein
MRNILIALFLTPVACFGCNCEDLEEGEVKQLCEFYCDPIIELDGHLWRPILLLHHPDCPCIKLDKPSGKT